MSVKLRPYNGGAAWEADIQIRWPDGTVARDRRKVPVSGKTAALRWAEARERLLFAEGKKPARESTNVVAVPTLQEFAPRFVEGYARANKQKPSGIAGKESILRVHLIPRLGIKPLDAIKTEDVQQLKVALGGKAPKTVNNVLTVLGTLLKTAVDWDVLGRIPCVIKLLKTPKTTASFHGFEEYERLVAAAKGDGQSALLIVLLGGQAGLRCGEIMALEWSDVDIAQRQVTVARSEWKGHVTPTKGGRVRHVRLTDRLSAALREARHLRGPRVVCDEAGQPLTQKMVQCTLRRVARRANVKAGVHILRHTFCSHLAMQGAPARAIQELAGHQDLSTTQRYMHLSPATLDAAIRLLDGPQIGRVRGEIVEAAGNRL